MIQPELKTLVVKLLEPDPLQQILEHFRRHAFLVLVALHLA